MQDLTKITTPYGLLDEKTREALKAHGGPYQHYDWSSECWVPIGHESPGWFKSTTYRVKPTLLVYERWVNMYPGGEEIGFTTKEIADTHASGDRIACLHIRQEYQEGDGL